MQFQITLPEPNVGREDRLIRAVVAACLLSMSAFGLISTRSLSLISLLFALSGGYFAWSAAKARCFAYERLAIDTRSESEAAAQLARAAAAERDKQARGAEQPPMSTANCDQPQPGASTPSQTIDITTAAGQSHKTPLPGSKPGRARQLLAEEPLQVEPNQSDSDRVAPNRAKPEQTGSRRGQTHQSESSRVRTDRAKTDRAIASQDSKRSKPRRKDASTDEWGHSLLGG